MGVEKIIEKMKRQPNGIRPEEIEKDTKERKGEFVNECKRLYEVTLHKNCTRDE